MPIRDDFERILIVRLSAIGDVVINSSVAKALRRQFPKSYIAWVVEDKAKDALLGSPYLDEVIVWKRRPGFIGSPAYLQSLNEVRREMRSRQFTVAIDFQGLLRSALITRLSGARHRVGYDTARERSHLLYSKCFHIPDRGLRGGDLYREMLGLIGVPADDLEPHFPVPEDDRVFARAFIAGALSSHPSATAVAALCPATTWVHKHWTEEGWAEVADRLARDHGILPVFLGSKADTALIQRISARMKSDAVSTAGMTSLKQVAAIMERSSFVISVDTGLLHIANALNRPLIGLYGPTTPDYIGRKDSLRVVAKALSCMPCFRHPGCQGFECMTTITADDVLSAAADLLGGKDATV